MANPLISAEDLAARSDTPALLDVRWQLGGPPGRPEYEQGHIPGAVFVDLDTELAGPPGAAGRHPLPTPERFEAAMRAAGLDHDGPVVAYDGGNLMAAARAWWLLRYFGHAAVQVLDGGLSAWIAAGYATTTEKPSIPPGNFVVRPGGMPTLDAEGAARLSAYGVLLDARAPERFRGEHEPVDPVAGHIPAARNLPVALTLGGDGRLLEPAALRELFRDRGVRAEAEVGVYCGSGVSAAQEVLALEVAGFRAALYPGSWSEWVTDPARPVSRGD